ncbi:NADPH quinone oxidoreductase [Mycobacterium tuberculosis]|nr:NADPH quinone oxidoreductase [Mycobacterium tuberculosis]
MRAVRVTRLEGPDAVEVAEVEEPTSAGVVIEVHAAGVAFPDALLTRGRYQYRPEPPFVLGAEIAGVVRSAPDNSQVRSGDRVVGLTMLTGGMAEVAVLSPERVFKLPDNMTFEAGAGVLFNDLTVYFALAVRGRLQAGETVLVHGAAGGIGTSTLRLAPALGASRTVAVVSTQEKAELATVAGATDVVLAEGFKDAVQELTNGRGVDIVVDPVGGDRFTDSLRSLAAGGRLLVIGFTGGEIPTVKVNRLLLNNIDVVGVGWGAWSLTHPDALAQQWSQLERLYARASCLLPNQWSTHWTKPLRRLHRWRIAPPRGRSYYACATNAPPGTRRRRALANLPLPHWSPLASATSCRTTRSLPGARHAAYPWYLPYSSHAVTQSSGCTSI